MGGPDLTRVCAACYRTGVYGAPCHHWAAAVSAMKDCLQEIHELGHHVAPTYLSWSRPAVIRLLDARKEAGE